MLVVSSGVFWEWGGRCFVPQCTSRTAYSLSLRPSPCRTRFPSTHQLPLTLQEVPSSMGSTSSRTGNRWSLIGISAIFFVRKEYSDLHKILREVDLIEKHPRALDVGGATARCVLITGNPGIGKTIALEDLLRRELQLRHFDHIMCVATRGIVHFTLDSTSREWTAVEYPWAYALALGSQFASQEDNKPRMLLLHDLKSTQSVVSYQVALVACLMEAFRMTVAAASSPDLENTKDLKKDFDACTTFYSDLWTHAESREVFVGSDAEFDAQFYVTGGVVRQLRGDLVAVKSEMLERLAGLDFDFMMQSRSNKDTQKFVAAVSCNGHRHLSGIEFVSGYAMDLWAEKAGEATVSHYRSLYLQFVKDKLHGGDVLEKFALAELLLFPLKADLLPLVAKAPAVSLELTEKVAVKRFSGRDAANVKTVPATTLYVPEAAQFPFVDFLLVYSDAKVDLFQSTVAAKHAPSISSVMSVLKHLKKNGLAPQRLIWIGPRRGGVRKGQNVVVEEKEANTPEAKKALVEYGRLAQYRWELT